MKKRKLLDLAINADTYAWEPFPHNQWARDMLYRKLYRPNLNLSILLHKLWESFDVAGDPRSRAIEILSEALHEKTQEPI